MPMMPSVPSGTPGDFASLCAWLYDVDQYGKARRMRSAADSPALIPLETVSPGETLHVAVDDGKNARKTERQRYLWVPKAEGMAFNPVTIGLDVRTGY